MDAGRSMLGVTCGFGVGGWSYSNFLASTVKGPQEDMGPAKG